MAAPSPRVFIIVRAPNGDVREVPVGATAVVIGRDESADIRVEDKKVSRRHAAFRLIEGEPWVEDLGSANGVKLNGKKVNKRARISAGDRVRVGGYEVALRDRIDETGAAPAATQTPVPVESKTSPVVPRVASTSEVVLEGLDAPCQGRSYPLPVGEHLLGRQEDCSVPIMDGSVSRQHARIVRTSDRVTIQDLGSSNGSFVNDMRIDTTGLADGDAIRVGNIRFTINMPPALSAQDAIPSRATRVRTKGVDKSRTWLLRGIVILATTITMLSFLLYKKNRDRWTISGGGVRVDTASVAGNLETEPATVAFVPPQPTTSPEDAGLQPKPPAVADSGIRVDPSFDFEAFVAEKLAAARALEADKDYAKLRLVLIDLLERDPINAEAKATLDRLNIVEGAEEAMKRAQAHEEKKELARALKAYASVPEGAPQAALARARVEALRAEAIVQELTRAQADLEDKDKKVWLRAHRRFKDVLDLDPASEGALAGVRKAERKLRGKGVRFVAWTPAGERPQEQGPKEVRDAIASFHKNDDPLTKVAELYARGSMAKAIKRAESPDVAKREEGKRMKRTLRDIEALYERIKNEISNDPNAAWSKLSELQAKEREVLPKGMRSFVVKELEESIAESFAGAGGALYEREKFEDAFQRWDAGAKLDPQNPKIAAGLKKLDVRAKTMSDEAELATQRGDKTACAQWKAISRVTRADSELHKRATERARQTCTS